MGRIKGSWAATSQSSAPYAEAKASSIPSPPSETTQVMISASRQQRRNASSTACPACAEVRHPLNESTATIIFMLQKYKKETTSTSPFSQKPTIFNDSTNTCSFIFIILQKSIEHCQWFRYGRTSENYRASP